MTQKEGSWRTHILSASALFLVLLSLLSLAALAADTTHVTDIPASAVPPPAMLFSQVRELVSSFPLLRYIGDGAQVCLLIRTGAAEFSSFELFKDRDVLEITPSPYSTYCQNTPANEGPEDIVIQYVDYAAFRRNLQSPTCENFKKGGAGREFYYLPSEFMKAGGTPVCNEVFTARYCPALRQCLSPAELAATGLGCCTEHPAYALLGNTLFLALVALALMLSFILVIWLIVRRGHREAVLANMGVRAKKTGELRGYIENAIKKGYSTKDVRTHLRKIGWNDEAIDHALAPYEKQEW